MEAEANFTSKSESAPKYFPDKSGATIPLLKFHLSFATLYNIFALAPFSITPPLSAAAAFAAESASITFLFPTLSV